MNVSGRARLLVLVASIGLISGCGSGGGTAASPAPSVAASPSEASSASPSAAGSPSGTPIAHGTFGIVPSMAGLRLFLLHNPKSDLPVAILIDDAAKGGSDYGDGTAWTDAAQKVIDTITFSP